MKDKEPKTPKRPAREEASAERVEDGRASRSSKHPIGSGPEAGHVIQPAQTDDRERAGERAERPPGGEGGAGEGSLTWSRDPSNPSASTGRARPARMYADDEQEQSANLARRGVEDAQSDLARTARSAEFGKSTRRE